MVILLRRILGLFLVIFAITALLTICGLIYLWFINPQAQMPYLRWLLGIVVAEVVGTIILLARRGIQYLPEVHINSTAEQTAQFMEEFISHGSSVTIVSNRLGWFQDAAGVQLKMVERAQKGTRFEIITAQQLDPVLMQRLQEAGIRLFTTNDAAAPEARFTLINADRSGAERLAIARGTHPNHEITIFDNGSGPQIIALAKDIVRKSKSAAVHDGQ
jgi:hypothetical protein